MNGSAQPNPQPQGPTPQPQPSAPNNQGVNVPHPRAAGIAFGDARQGEQVQDFSASSQPPGSHLARLGWVLGVVVLAVGVILFALHYFEVIYLGEQLPFLPSTSLRTSPSRSGGDQKITEVSQNITNGTSSQLSIGCPVQDVLCKLGKEVIYNGHPAIAYKIPSGIEVLSSLPAVDLTDSSSGIGSQLLGRSVRQTTIVSNNCYTITYILPPDASIEQYDLLPLEKGKVLARTGPSSIKVADEEFKLLVQVQKRTIEPALLGKPDFQQCAAANIIPEKIGEYQRFEVILPK